MNITEERLKELVKQGNDVYAILYGDVFRIVSKNIEIDNNNNNYILIKEEPPYTIPLVNLYEHEYDAIHASKYVNMERVEKLSLPFWSEVVKKSGEWSLIFKRYGCEYLLSFVINDKDKNWITLFINHKNNKKPRFAQSWSSELTQESYAKACKIIKKIWKGESL